jgi:endonuclease/exonuclease/phosphatase family metal-dependent hydrolase
MKQILLFTLVLYGQFNFNFLCAQEKNEKKVLNVLSWNIYMLPAYTNLSPKIKKNYRKSRAKEISDRLNQSEYNILVFQEAFHVPSRRILKREMKERFPYQYGPINPRGLSLKTNSGVLVLSETPLKLLAKTKYKRCSGSDCYSKKGAAIWEGFWGNNEFQIIGTHLNSGRSDTDIRESQIDQIREELMVPHLKLGVPQIICGDMNTRKLNVEAYNCMLETLYAEDEEVNTARKSTKPPKIENEEIVSDPSDNHHIDYILHCSNGSNIKVLQKDIVTFKAKKPYKTEVLRGTLSDHLAVEISIDFD